MVSSNIKTQLSGIIAQQIYSHGYQTEIQYNGTASVALNLARERVPESGKLSCNLMPEQNRVKHSLRHCRHKQIVSLCSGPFSYHHPHPHHHYYFYLFCFLKSPSTSILKIGQVFEPLFAPLEPQPGTVNNSEQGIEVWNPTESYEDWHLVTKSSRRTALVCEQLGPVLRLRVVPIFPQGQQSERNASAHAKHPTRERRDTEIFTRDRVSLALVSLRKNGDYSQSNQFWAGCSYQVGVFFMSTRKVILYNLDIA